MTESTVCLGATMQSEDRWLCGEPTLDEMLADPIVRIVMARDGVSDETVRSVLEEAAKRLRLRPGETTQAA
jgi:hypothetical protein